MRLERDWSINTHRQTPWKLSCWHGTVHIIKFELSSVTISWNGCFRKNLNLIFTWNDVMSSLIVNPVNLLIYGNGVRLVCTVLIGNEKNDDKLRQSCAMRFSDEKYMLVWLICHTCGKVITICINNGHRDVQWCLLDRVTYTAVVLSIY